MGYLHIDNLYKDQSILEFKHVYALEKIHGTSAHIQWMRNDATGHLTFFSGGEKHERFVSLFDKDKLAAKFEEMFGIPEEPVIVYGEAYGGKQQGMSATYGPDLRFIVFDVKVGDNWLTVPRAEHVANMLGLNFVNYVLIKTEVEAINAERDKPSYEASTLGIIAHREGIVLRPPFEVTLNNGKRLIAKHKREEFSERASKKDTTLDPGKVEVMQQAEAIAHEWVTPHRLDHVLDKLKATFKRDPEIQWIPAVIKAMVDDVHRESEGEVIWADPVKKAVGTRAVKLFKEYLNRAVQDRTTTPVG